MEYVALDVAPNSPIEEPHPSHRIIADRFLTSVLPQLFLALRTADRFAGTNRAARPYHVHQKAATASRSFADGPVSRQITVVPTCFTDRELAAAEESELECGVLVCTSFAPSLSCSVYISLSFSLPLSFSAGKVDLSSGRSYYLLFSLLTTHDRFHPVKPSA